MTTTPTRTLEDEEVAMLPRRKPRAHRYVLGSTTLAYVGLKDTDIARPTETARQVTKRSKATLDAAVASLKPQAPTR